jgi:hypothetical protein
MRNSLVFERLELPPTPDRTDPGTAAAFTMVEAGSLASALRPKLKAAGIDPRFMPLVMSFATVPSPTQRLTDIAWRLGISTGAASHLLDRAEQRGLVTKRGEPMDRRGTWISLTSKVARTKPTFTH